MRALKTCLALLKRETSVASLFPRAPVVRFRCETRVCCGRSELTVAKTRRKTVQSLVGPFVAHETLLECGVCSKVHPSEELLRLVPARCNFAYDVMVFAGRALFLKNRTIQEVVDELAERNVAISRSEAGYLGRKFILHLAAAHKRATPRINRATALSGGYVLHLDAAHEADAPVLFTGIDGLSKIVLASVKMPSESSEHIAPFLKTLRENYGEPAACVHDMGKGVCKAVADELPGVPDYICHYHFLGDIGTDLLEDSYGSLRKSLRKHSAGTRLSSLAREAKKALGGKADYSNRLAKAIGNALKPDSPELVEPALIYSLSLWILQGKHCGDGYGFPFDRPLLEFSERILQTRASLHEIKDSAGEARLDGKFMKKFEGIVLDVATDEDFLKSIDELRWRARIFDRLRRAMRFALPNGADGLNENGANVDMRLVEDSVSKFKKRIKKDKKLSSDRLILNMLKQIDKYAEKLFASPVIVDTPNGEIAVFPQRTNNILEQFFRGMRRAHRRKTGNDCMRREFRSMLADTPLVRNLENPEYMKILLDGKENLEELFAELGENEVKDIEKSQAGNNLILPGFATLAKLKKLPEQIIYFLASLAK